MQSPRFCESNTFLSRVLTSHHPHNVTTSTTTNQQYMKEKDSETIFITGTPKIILRNICCRLKTLLFTILPFLFTVTIQIQYRYFHFRRFFLRLLNQFSCYHAFLVFFTFLPDQQIYFNGKTLNNSFYI